jgi:hypothetical protein
MFWKKKDLVEEGQLQLPNVKPPKKEDHVKYKEISTNTLTIQTKSSGKMSWTIEPWEDTVKIEPWIKFYIWFFGRSGDFFVMKFNTGETMIRRDEIITFTVFISTKKEIDK